MLVNRGFDNECCLNMCVNGWNCNYDGVWRRFDQPVNVFDMFSKVTRNFDH